jgi:hypothetical protein
MSVDVMRARVAFRDRPFIDVMDLAVRFLIVHVRLYAKVAMFVLVPCVAITLAGAWLDGWLTAWVLAFLLSFAAQVPFTVLASRLVFQESVSARAVVASGLRDVPRVLAMRTLWAVLITVGLGLLVAGALYPGAVLLFVDEVMILERSSVAAALGRSQRITSSSMSDAIVGVLMVAIVPAVAVLLADFGGRTFIGEVLQFREPAPLLSEGGSVLGILGWFGVLPYVTTARFFSYLNMRTRAEGWDIQTRFAALSARADRASVA